MWKWNLAFQCIVNIGVRGSEAVRTRVVEADMVPVIATILDNYFQVVEKSRERLELENRRKCPFGSSRSFSRSSNRTESQEHRSGRSRRHAPPPISIPEPSESPDDEPTSEVTPTVHTANLSLSSPPERTVFPRQQTHQRPNGGRAHFASPTTTTPQPPMSSLTLQSNGFVRPVRDIDRLPSMMPTLHAELSSQPQSPTTPGPPAQQPESSRPRRRPSIRHQLSISGSDDDGQIEEAVEEQSTEAESEPMVGITGTDIAMEDIRADIGGQQNTGVTLPDVSSVDDDTFHISQGSNDGNHTATPTQGHALRTRNTNTTVTCFQCYSLYISRPSPCVSHSSPQSSH